MKYMSVEEFRKKGLLHEVNRNLLHPLGLALEVRQREDGTEFLSGIQDNRHDPEGMCFSDSELDAGYIKSVKDMQRKVFHKRVKALKYWIQGETTHDTM